MKKNLTILTIWAVILLVSAFVLAAAPALADVRELVREINPDVEYTTVEEIINVIFNALITIAGAIFMIMLLIGGVTYLTSAGDEEGTAKAKRRLLDAIIGLVIVLAAWAIGNWVIDKLTGEGGGGFWA